MRRGESEILFRFPGTGTGTVPGAVLYKYTFFTLRTGQSVLSLVARLTGRCVHLSQSCGVRVESSCPAVRCRAVRALWVGALRSARLT